MDIEDIKMAIKNADPAAKMAAGGAIGGLAGAGFGGLLGGWKGAGIGGVLGGAAGVAGAAAIPESGPLENIKYIDHAVKTSLLGKKPANWMQKHPVATRAGMYASGLSGSGIEGAATWAGVGFVGLNKLYRLVAETSGLKPGFFNFKPGSESEGT